MKYLAALLILFVPVFLFAKVKPKVALLEISVENMDEETEGTAKIIRNKLEYSFFSSGKYDLLERNAIQVIIKERGLINGNFENTAYALKAGKFLSSDFVIAGSLSHAGEYTLNIKIIDISREKILFIATKSFSDKNGYIKIITILSDEMKTAIDNRETQAIDSVKSGKQFNFNIMLSGGAAFPLFTWETLSKTGFNVRFQTYFELKNVPSFTFGLSGGYVKNDLKETGNYAHGIHIMAGIGYSFRIKEVISIIPQIYAGVNYSILQTDQTIKAFEPILTPGLLLTFRLSKNLNISISSDWSFIFESAGAIQNINLNAGIGICI